MVITVMGMMMEIKENITFKKNYEITKTIFRLFFAYISNYCYLPLQQQQNTAALRDHINFE